MTIFYPDVSNHNPGLIIQPGTVAVSAKASEGTTFIDGQYNNFRQQAQRVGALFFAYHWLHHGNADAQAAHCFSIVGATPVMIDWEETAAGDVPTVADCLTFARGLRSRGGVCPLVYVPQWYWADPRYLNKPDLRPLDTAGLSVVASNYTTYSDTGPGWNSYGGIKPVIWQYTDKQSYGGRAVDFNAFRGSPDDLRRLIYGAPTGGSGMEQKDVAVSDTVPETARGNTVGDILVDEGNLRDEWYYAPGTHSKNPPQPGSRFDLLMQAVDKVLAGGVGAPTQDQVDAAVAKALPAAVAAALTDPATLAELGAAIVAAFKKS